MHLSPVRWILLGLLGLGLTAGAGLVWRAGWVAERPLGRVADLRALRERDDLSLVFVLIDTLRADHLGAYGYERQTSPVLDRLAASGIRFGRVRSQSTWTKTSMASLWTAAYPARTGVLRFQHALPERIRMPAEILHDAGLRTTGIWRNGWVANNFGFAQGFDAYFRPAPSRTTERFAGRNPSAHPLQGTDLDITEAAVEFLRAYRDRRFFLYLHYMDVHQYLYEEASAKFGTRYIDAYDNAIHWVDRNLEVLLQELARLALARRTLVVVASDHGEAFYEHGIEGHARNLYREVTETPWVIALPFRLDPGIGVEPRVQNVDIWPTLLDLLGLESPPHGQGRSLLPLIEFAGGTGAADPADLTQRTAFAHLDLTWGRTGADPRPQISMTRDRYRLIHVPGEPQRDELFDLQIDPAEQHNRARALPGVTARLRREVERYATDTTSPWGSPTEVELDAMRLEQLRALGYVVGED